MKNEADKIAASLFNGWLRAAENDDEKWFRDHLLEEFHYLNAGGDVMNKQEIIEINMAAKNKYELREAFGCFYGPVLVTRGLYFAKGMIPENPKISAAAREKYARGLDLTFSQVWVASGQSFRCVMLQTTGRG